MNNERSFWALITLTLTSVTILLFFPSTHYLTKGLNTQSKKEDLSVMAKNWGWAKIISQPVPVITTNKNDHLFLGQVKFEIGDGPIHTALINKRISLEDWKIGDEILVACVPGTVDNIPTPTFIVIDYRPQEKK